jgi:hypothetical protein
MKRQIRHVFGVIMDPRAPAAHARQPEDLNRVPLEMGLAR